MKWFAESALGRLLTYVQLMLRSDYTDATRGSFGAETEIRLPSYA